VGLERGPLSLNNSPCRHPLPVPFTDMYPQFTVISFILLRLISNVQTYSNSLQAITMYNQNKGSTNVSRNKLAPCYTGFHGEVKQSYRNKLLRVPTGSGQISCD
jgi:hypothetical protein